MIFCEYQYFKTMLQILSKLFYTSLISLGMKLTHIKNPDSISCIFTLLVAKKLITLIIYTSIYSNNVLMNFI